MVVRGNSDERRCGDGGGVGELVAGSRLLTVDYGYQLPATCYRLKKICVYCKKVVSLHREISGRWPVASGCK